MILRDDKTITIKYPNREEETFINISTDHARGVAAYLAAVGVTLLIVAGVWYTQDALSPQGLKELIGTLAGSILGLLALFVTVGRGFRYGAALLLTAVTLYGASELSVRADILVRLLAPMLGMTVVALLLRRYPLKVLIDGCFILLFFITVIMIYLGETYHAEVPDFIAGFGWWALVCVSCLMLLLALLVGNYPDRISESIDRCEKRYRGW